MLEIDVPYPREIGKGRAAIVLEDFDEHGSRVARKIFTTGDLVSKPSNYLTTGTPNPHNWCEDAVQSAYYQRKILEFLFPYWTDSKARIAKAYGWIWNEEYKGYELVTEFIDGKSASLHHPFSAEREHELSDLVNNVMKPLQKRAAEWGFYGTRWQTGEKNPTASSNFKLVEYADGNNAISTEWVCVDNESGVPVLIPTAYFAYYGKGFGRNIWEQGRPIFDDVDINTLREKIASSKSDLEARIGIEQYNTLLQDVNSLEYHQKRWKSMSILERSLTYRLKQGAVSQEQVEWYSNHPFLWFSREAARISFKSLYNLASEPAWSVYNWTVLKGCEAYYNKAWKFFYSQKYREASAKNLISRRIDAMEERKQFTANQARELKEQIDKAEVKSYVTDFWSHMVVKIPEKIIQFVGLPLLYAAGGISLAEMGFGILITGSVLREAYTMYRMIEDLHLIEKAKHATQAIGSLPNQSENILTIFNNFARERYQKMFGDKPFIDVYDLVNYAAKSIIETKHVVAMSLGWIPSAGIIAYPVEGPLNPAARKHKLTHFLLDDLMAAVGRHVPVIGGNDTLTEHFFNRLFSKKFGKIQ